ncbi:hypothetical protein CLV46_0325 [Diaminobutyricimonas aerilata]|uniref:DUF916 domain-containing protein n=1 Tax=Diaminobutyricimonas aerilata TaxID=1162967 RepID=A0A2M9CFZ6_9MICO|nr:hypothetical protein [Diaminobutyricimonas aerilata]PJJ70798.1 hypothetical protein CLV46_0325 [Diaminobutyricimonas aerilata]
MRFPVRRAALLLALVAGCSAASGAITSSAAPPGHPATTTESTETTWAFQPSTGGVPDGRVSLRHRLDPGATVTDALALTNYSAQSVAFDVFASDGVVTEGGSFDILPEGEESTGAGEWVTFGRLDGARPRDGGGITVEVPGRTVLAVPVEVRVPEDASPGDHPAGIVAELSRSSEDVDLTSRVGVRLHLRVTGDVVARLEVRDTQVSFEPSWNPFAPGTATVRFSVANSGNVRLGAESTVTAAGPFGAAPATASTEQREVLPGQHAAVTVRMPVWPLLASWGDIDIRAGVVGDDDLDVEPEGDTASFVASTVPWPTLLYLVVLAGLLLALRLSRRRAAARVQARIDAAVAAATTPATPATPAPDPGARVGE